MASFDARLRHRARSRWLALGAGASTRKAPRLPPSSDTSSYEFNDSHFHLTNYIQRGHGRSRFLKIMGDTRRARRAVRHSAAAGVDDAVSGDNAPTYYLHTDAPLYYYSFTDAYIAMAVPVALAGERARFDPMITGFNPARHVRGGSHPPRARRRFPACSPASASSRSTRNSSPTKIAGEAASLLDPALDSILAFAGEVGLLVLLHSDMDVPFAKRQRDAGVPRRR